MGANPLNIFFSAPRFAVVGASSDPHKFGHKVFQWYIARGLRVTPINPRVRQVFARSNPSSSSLDTSYPQNSNLTAFNTLPSINHLPCPDSTSLSIVTPPQVTLQILRAASSAGIKAVWIQPGAFDDHCLQYATQPGTFDVVIAGSHAQATQNLSNSSSVPTTTTILTSSNPHGWCVLVDGDATLNSLASSNSSSSKV